MSILSQTGAPMRAKAKTLSIISGKGGVGKTTIALKVALELSGSGKKVLLIDCDYNLSNTLIKLGLPLNDNFHEFISHKKTFEQAILKRENLHLLAGCNGNMDLFENQINLDRIIIDVLYIYEYQYDYIILDSPAGLMKTILNLNAYCDDRIVIVTPDKSAITDAYSLIKVLYSKYGVKENHLLVNRVTTEKQYLRIVKSLSETVENFLKCRTIPIGELQNQEKNPEFFDHFMLFDPRSEIHKSFIKVLDRYTDKEGRSGEETRNASLVCHHNREGVPNGISHN